MYRRPLTALIVTALMIVAAGCSSSGHQVLAKQEGQIIACRLCYNQAVRMRTRAVGPGHIIRKHQCPDCIKEVTTYVEGDKAMIKCSHCAPEGAACDLCLPPTAGS